MTKLERPQNTVRFVVVAPDGRRSAEWRVWTGSGKKVTDELYMTPRARAGEFKFSLHSSNYAQLGHIEKARAAMRPGDQYATDRWEIPQVPIVGNWRAALCLWFPESELRQTPDGSLSSSVVKIPAAPPGQATAVIAAFGTATDSLDGLTVAGVLDQASGGKIALIHLPINIPPLLVPALHAREASRIPLQIPGFAPTEPFAWELVPGKDGGRLVVEFAPPERGAALPPLPPLIGTVLPWTEVPVSFLDLLPEPYREFSLACAILVYGPNGTSRLYVDQHARCDHTSLGAECQQLCDDVDRGHVDQIWQPLPTGELHRIISTRRVLEEAGIDPDNPVLM
ncbi:hypothetical protein FEK33_17240 [Nocardia asteroides NBRC 15531]|nr:hypothetical protein [Nocardia asteroides]TLF67659.1 hypothetical protein FEK33_17240 [Nocardia asteroides NBRC 15531]UGT50836.1 hypothetical protein LT345_09990 [Nocardia asteroides]SFN47645.1 hypothetical protein SAMN05444423_109251 [Nocardia asteroides]VEG36320.1 Uncharacterised protein [Nocardia asteroides]